jgi:hypothetical protein
MITEMTTLVAAKEHTACSLDGEVTILNTRNAVFYGLDGVGAFVWSHLAEPTRFEDLQRHVRDSYDIDAATCRADLLALLNRLADEGLVEVQ